MLRDVFIVLWMFICAVLDLKTHKVPNSMIITGILLSMYLKCRGNPDLFGAVTEYSLYFFVMIMLWSLPFKLRMIGAGDIKLMAVLAGFYEKHSFTQIAVGFFVGAVLSAWKLYKNKSFLERFLYLKAFIGQISRSGLKDQKYFIARRDGYKNTIPLAFCFLAGLILDFIWRYL